MTQIDIYRANYLAAVAIPLEMGSFRPIFSIAASTKFAPRSPVRTTTTAVTEEFTPEPQETMSHQCPSANYRKDA